ncbi:hypothetical protein [Pleionea sp. CnH1-48]|uniref:hypothetical protein n=1 Tax=Pleionea sp. CnH1-48 TaxID=2954494 RepID=UPI002096E596|nr:hypothetical protein [Pleionea sp. CnH1-48]MCO7226553.1 hypothetical protein [Pleionea sp. CnH1-48]
MNSAIRNIKQKAQQDALSFTELRKLAIELSQQTSGQLWTDYNVHDPGVTIWEQLCYALTELSYYADFNVPDYLCNKNEELDFQKLALHLPEDIFPSEAVTTTDLKKVILDQVPAVEDLRVIPLSTEEAGVSGLYDIIVSVDQQAESHTLTDNKSSLIEQVSRVFHANRSMGEDLRQIYTVDEQYCELHAEIDINSQRAPEYILAELYYQCLQHISGSKKCFSYSDYGESEEVNLEHLFRGPFTQHGFFKDDDLADDFKEIAISSFFSFVKEIDGVEDIVELSFLVDGKPVPYFDKSNYSVQTRLKIPESQEDIKVKLSINKRSVSVPFEQLKVRYEELVFKNSSLRRAKFNATDLYSKPRGNYIDLSSYSSIQNDFPATYGINRFGIPRSESNERKAQAAQLKAYLLIFDQIIANRVSYINNIKQLFSNDMGFKQSYKDFELSNESAGDIESLFLEDRKDILSELNTKFDNLLDRKSRLLDYFIALYGESFTQNSLRHYNYYYTNTQLESLIVKNKIRFLHLIEKVTRDRASAFNYKQASWGRPNVSGLQLKCSLLLGFKRYSCHSLSFGIFRNGIQLSEGNLDSYESGKEITFPETSESISTQDVSNDYIHIEAREVFGSYSLEKVREAFEGKFPVSESFISDKLLTQGIFLDNYRITERHQDEFRVVFFDAECRVWRTIADFDSYDKAVIAVNKLQQFLIHINLESEGMHVVEHLLLRPRSQDDWSSEEKAFCNMTVSIVLPSWTARCSSNKFQQFTEETIRLNCPAHILPKFHWLSIKEMFQFEVAYKKWLKLLESDLCKPEDIDPISEKLRNILMEKKA